MKVLLVDDHALFREGLGMMIREAVPSAQVLHAGSCAEALELAAREALNLIFLDIGLPDGNGLDALGKMKQTRPSVPVVVVTGDAERATAERAVALNAMGVILKTASSQEMLAAILPALSGGVPLPPSLLPAGKGAPAPAGGAIRAGLMVTTDAAALGLTPRQYEVLRLLVQGLPNKLIARQMDISLQGAKKHVSDLLAHFQVMSRAQLIVYMAQQRYALGTPRLVAPGEEPAPDS